jgi:hypothetical protein
MGIVSCANEQYGRVGPLGSIVDPAVARHLGKDWDSSVFNVVTRVLTEAAEMGETPAQAANRQADAAAKELHPGRQDYGALYLKCCRLSPTHSLTHSLTHSIITVWGHRSYAIANALFEEKWEDGSS